MVRIVEPLEDVEKAELESYSGFITTNTSIESNMFFWFFSAIVSNTGE